jgi:hypothetical protein
VLDPQILQHDEQITRARISQIAREHLKGLKNHVIYPDTAFLEQHP